MSARARRSRRSTTRRHLVHILHLALDSLHLRGQVSNPRLQLIDRIIQRLNLRRKLLIACSALVVLCLQRSRQRVHRRHHLVHAVVVLLHQVDDHAHALVVGGLQVLHHVLQLLHLGLQLNHFLGNGKRMRREE